MIEQLDLNNFESKVLNSEGVNVVKIYTESCPNCKTLAPYFEKASETENDNFHFFEMNAPDGIDWVKKYKILGVPAMLFFRNGLLLDKKTGVLTSDKILNRLEKVAKIEDDKIAQKEVTSYFKLPWK